MVNGYSDVHTNVSESVTIMGVDFYAENIQADEPFNRREQKVTPIIGGTERVTNGKYIHREYSFTTVWYFPIGKPHYYDNIFKEMMSKPVTVKSEYMGGTFKAFIKIHQTFPENSPNHMELDVTVTEVPDVKTNIPGESNLKVPKKPKKIKVEPKKKNSSSKNKSTKTKKTKSKKNAVKKKNK